jgi:subtilisin family serine protease/subtilisin-like proprotein convertase family protein
MGSIANVSRWVTVVLLVTVCSQLEGAGVFQFREPLVRRYELTPAPTLQSLPDPDWLSATALDTEPRRVLLSRRLVLQLQPGAELVPLLTAHGLAVDRVVDDDLLVVTAANPLAAATTADELAGNPQVAACYPIMRRESKPDSGYAAQPNDQYYLLQAYHEFRDANGNAVGADINTRAAWPYTTGQGVTVAVADTGVQPTHPDLANQLADGEQHNFVTGTDDGTAPGLTGSLAHGMGVSGLALAEGNNHVGMIGVAPGARLASWVIYDANLMLAPEDSLMAMYAWHENAVAVQNHSWSKGSRIDLYGPGLLEQAGITDAIENGRNGRGVIMVRSAGNYRTQGQNASEDFYVEDPRVIAVAAVANSGRAASYSNPGAPLLVSAPGGEPSGSPPFMFTLDFLGADGATNIKLWLPTDPAHTTNLWDYRYDYNPFAGTSAAAPLVAGTCALMLSVNPNLTYRDVQQILLLSARHLDLADPDLHPNGAGLLVSHNQGFGIVDAGQAVRLAKGWINRPPAVWRTNTVSVNLPIPDDGYHLVITGTALPASLGYLTNIPSLGVHADATTAVIPIVDVGLANTPLAVNLTGKAALIERGGSDFSVKIGNAADAGAVFAVVFNYVSGTGACPGGDQLCGMGATDYVPIPAVFIGNTQGTAIRDQLQQQGDAMAQLQVHSVAATFSISESLLLEHVGIRLKTDHPLRGDLHISLVSPQGTRSILQRYNADLNPGPLDWTYYTTHDFYESSVGQWRLEVLDEALANTGSVLEASLILQGVPITDSDADGLDDHWEMSHFQSLAQGPADDPDHDGYSNAREQVMQTDPTVEEIPFRVDPVAWNARLVRLSWPGVAGVNYEIRSGQNVTGLQGVATVPGVFPETVWFTTYTNLQSEFFEVRRLP